MYNANQQLQMLKEEEETKQNIQPQIDPYIFNSTPFTDTQKNPLPYSFNEPIRATIFVVPISKPTNIFFCSILLSLYYDLIFKI